MGSKTPNAPGPTVQARDRLEEAERLHRAAIAQDPGNARAHRDLGILLLDLDRSVEAIAPLARSVELSPKDAKALNNLGFALERCGELKRATEAFEACIEHDPRYLSAHVNVILTLERRNEVTAARRYLDLARRQFPNDSSLTLPEALVLKREGRFEQAIGLLEAGNYDQAPQTAMRAKHELGRLYDRVGETAKAFRQFTELNAYVVETRGLTPERAAGYLETLDTYRRTFSEPWIESWTKLDRPDPARDPAFLLGFPRSGTTLLQQMLGCHPSVHVAGEARAIWELEAEARRQVADYPTGLGGITGREAASLRQLYFSAHRAESDWTLSDLFVDKTPLLAPLGGLVARIFPGAKMIFLLRHPCDVVLSCFISPFVRFYNLSELVEIYGRVMDLWQHYVSLLPLTVHQLRYEDLVEDSSREMRRLLAFLDLPWDDAVMRHDERDAQSAGLRVPGYDLVSERPYRHARFRWRRYRAHLEPHLAQLEPYCRHYGYEI